MCNSSLQHFYETNPTRMDRGFEMEKPGSSASRRLCGYMRITKRTQVMSPQQGSLYIGGPCTQGVAALYPGLTYCRPFRTCGRSLGAPFKVSSSRFKVMNIGSLSVFNPCFIRGYGKFRVSAESAKSADALTPALSHPMGEGNDHGLAELVPPTLCVRRISLRGFFGSA